MLVMNVASAALALALQQPAPAAPLLPADSAVRALVAPRVTLPGTGMVVGLLDASGARRFVAVGVPDDRVFEIGSVTKTFTAAILADMVARGEVRLDDPVAKFLPASVRVPSYNGKQITLVDLATQSSGLPRLPGDFAPHDSSNPYADYSVAQLYAFLSSYQLPRDVGATYEYSNLGMGLLGHALTLKARMSYEDLVHQRVLTPLGMRETAVTLTPALAARLTPGHDAEGHVVPNWDLPTLAGAGALRSTARDMLTFLAANIDTARAALNRELATTHAPRHAAGSPAMQIGLAWHILSRPGGSIVWHNGGTGGYRSFVGFDPVRRVGIVILANSNNAAVDDLGFHLIDQTFSLQPLPQPRTEIALDSTVLARYVGEYELAPTFHITITREGTRLFLQATAQPRVPIYAESDSTFFLKVVEAQVTFRPDGIVLHQNGQHIPGRKLPQ